MVTENATSILNRKSPMNFSLSVVTLVFPSDGLKSECPFSGQTPLETLARENAQLNFCHVEPRAVRRGIVKAQTRGNTVCLSFAKSLNQRPKGVRIQVIQHHINDKGMGIEDIHQIAHRLSKIAFPALACDQNRPPSGFRFDKQEQIARPLTLVFVVLTSAVSGFKRQRFTDMRQQLGHLLIKTDHWTLRVIGLCIQAEDDFHSLDEGFGQLGNTPLTYLPGFEMFFCSSRRTLSTGMLSTIPSVSKRSVSSSSVQRSRPSGGALQANAIRCPSCCSFNSGSRSAPASSANAASTPASQNRKRIRRTVDSLIYSHWLISASVLPSALLSRICARCINDALLRPLVTMATSFRRSLSLRVTLCFSMPSFYFNPSI